MAGKQAINIEDLRRAMAEQKWLDRHRKGTDANNRYMELCRKYGYGPGGRKYAEEIKLQNTPGRSRSE